MWTANKASLKADLYNQKQYCNPKPIHKPYPVIMVGGEGERYLLKVVAKHADRYNLFFGSPDLMKRKISILRDEVFEVLLEETLMN